MQKHEKFHNIYDAENAIREVIKNDNNCSAHFKFHGMRSNGKNKLDLITYNPKTKTHFLLNSIDMMAGEIELYNCMYEHLVNLKETLKNKESVYVTYQIVWYNNNESKLETSFFYGTSINDILKKFYYEKYPDSYVIYNMKLMPES